MTPRAAKAQQEVRVERRREDVVDLRLDVGRGDARGVERPCQDRHEAAVDDDDDTVQQRADERPGSSRVAAVRPQATRRSRRPSPTAAA